MSERPPTSRDLIERARRYVRDGGVGTVTLQDGSTLPPVPICILSLEPDMLWFLFVFDDHPHGSYVASITEGDDGEVNVIGQDGEASLEIYTTWLPEQQATLNRWRSSLASQMVYLGVSPTPPNVVYYGGPPPRE
jgi:hypothetical protein